MVEENEEFGPNVEVDVDGAVDTVFAVAVAYVKEVW